MYIAQRLLPNREGALVDGLSLLVLAPGRVNHAQPRERGDQAQIQGAPGAFLESQQTVIVRLGQRHLGLRAVNGDDLFQRGGQARIARLEALGVLKRRFQLLLGLLVAPLLVGLPSRLHGAFPGGGGRLIERWGGGRRLRRGGGRLGERQSGLRGQQEGSQGGVQRFDPPHTLVYSHVRAAEGIIVCSDLR